MTTKPDEYWTEIVTALTTITGSFFVFKTKKRKQAQDTVEWLVNELREEVDRSNARATEALQLHSECLHKTETNMVVIGELHDKVALLESRLNAGDSYGS